MTETITIRTQQGEWQTAVLAKHGVFVVHRTVMGEYPEVMWENGLLCTVSHAPTGLALWKWFHTEDTAAACAQQFADSKADWSFTDQQEMTEEHQAIGMAILRPYIAQQQEDR